MKVIGPYLQTAPPANNNGILTAYHSLEEGRISSDEDLISPLASTTDITNQFTTTTDRVHHWACNRFNAPLFIITTTLGSLYASCQVQGSCGTNITALFFVSLGLTASAFAGSYYFRDRR